MAEKALTAVIQKRTFRASRPVQWMNSCRPWAARACRRARSHACARKSPGGSARFSTVPLEASGRISGSTRPNVKVRQDGHIGSVAVIVAIGANSDGRREVFGMDVGPSDGETHRTAFLRKLARRGLRGVKLVISDLPEGIKLSITKVRNASWQRCRVQFASLRSPRLRRHAQHPRSCWSLGLAGRRHRRPSGRIKRYISEHNRS